jgi:beta-mannanase
LFVNRPRRSVRISLIFVAAVAAMATVAMLAPADASGPRTAPAAKPAAAARTMALGADIKPSSGQSEEQAIEAFEATTGHKLAFTRDFLSWNSTFPTAYEKWLGARGTMPLISVKSITTGGTHESWAAIAAAQPGSAIYTQMKKWADEIKAYGYPVYFTFNHEPEAAASSSFGTTAQYIAAWQKFHSVFAAEGVTNAKFMWIMTSYAFLVKPSDRRYGWNWYPGDAYVDAIAADAYTEFTCRYSNGKWHSLSYQLAGFLKFGAQHPTKPMWLAEMGVVEDPATPGRKAQWITDAQALFKGSTYSQFAGVAYFNETRPGTACDWHVSTSASSQAAFNAMAQDPFYHGTAS